MLRASFAKVLAVATWRTARSLIMLNTMNYSKIRDQSLDECRRMQKSIDSNSRKSETWSHFFDVLIMQQLAIWVRKWSTLHLYLWLLLLRMFSLLTLAKPICLLFHIAYKNSIRIDAPKSSQEKREHPTPTPIPYTTVLYPIIPSLPHPFPSPNPLQILHSSPN